MKKIAIFTWYNSGMNYGQTLQAYGLQKVLKKQGYEVETITYGIGVFSNCRVINWYKKYRNLPKSKKVIQRKFDSFIRKNMNVSKPLKTKKQIEIYLNKKNFRVLICGSDQVWNPYNMDEVYYLNFDGMCKKVAYAPSIIAVKFVDKFKEYPEVSKWIKQLDAISVREKTGAEIIQRLANIQPKVVLDPTLLLEVEEWEKFVKPYTNKEKYLFCYLFDITDEQQDFIALVAQMRGCTKVFTADVLINNKLEIETIKDMSIEDFLSLIFHADTIITDSFHGTAFSVMFHKNFWVIDNGVADDCDKYYNIDRMITLLESLDIGERLLADVSQQDVSEFRDIDYVMVDEKLNHLKADSMNFLRNAIEQEKLNVK